MPKPPPSESSWALACESETWMSTVSPSLLSGRMRTVENRCIAYRLRWLVATAGLGLYVSRFADYGATYGSLAGVIILMLWFYVTAALLVVCAEIAAAFAREHYYVLRCLPGKSRMGLVQCSRQK